MARSLPHSNRLRVSTAPLSAPNLWNLRSLTLTNASHIRDPESSHRPSIFPNPPMHNRLS
ncbi:hypothetical protein SISSUDRAFT_1055049 [Sistotremastrum suecicum HHB10207 ss-3]|uniref:Uncharacterized protein n=1 Tax=Sistotremastrum suecicum HHB10207 ss-3 TaxID=1314776 RepID=A0A165XRS9_9AGAM|nr:hypothetical protein SISSUDRAFT_1055465 [Sistotremastrum suecicum HHB10207 ss-3]KZT32828.1 hypothetical protein SISSUDRAFT_1055049 [Sistotremastrum suecicum HHB10207 ss-3]